MGLGVQPLEPPGEDAFVAFLEPVPPFWGAPTPQKEPGSPVLSPLTVDIKRLCNILVIEISPFH